MAKGFIFVESQESFIYNDESALAYIHVLKVLSDEFKAKLSLEIKQKRKEIISEIIAFDSNGTSNKNKKIASLYS